MNQDGMCTSGDASHRTLKWYDNVFRPCSDQDSYILYRLVYLNHALCSDVHGMSHMLEST